MVEVSYSSIWIIFSKFFSSSFFCTSVAWEYEVIDAQVILVLKTSVLPFYYDYVHHIQWLFCEKMMSAERISKIERNLRKIYTYTSW